MTLVTNGLLGPLLLTGGLGAASVVPLVTHVDPLAVQRDNTLSDSIFGTVDPLAVQRDNTASDVIFGAVDPFAVNH